MATTSLFDYYGTRSNFDKLNPLIRSAYNNTSDFDEYKEKLLKKIDFDTQTGQTSVLNSIEDLRREQRVRLAQVEHDYYQENAIRSFDVPFYRQEIDSPILTSKPPIPTASRRSPSPIFVDDQSEQHIYHQPLSTNSVRHHETDLTFCPHRSDTIETPAHLTDLTPNYVQHQIESLWNEFELEDYIEKRKHRPPSAPTRGSWAGRVTKPQPFALTNATKLRNSHRRKCLHDAEAAKLQKEIDEELKMNKSFKANPVPAHVHLPLYEQLKDEQRARREQVRHMTKEYLQSISKPFGFDAREKSKDVIRRHSYSGEETFRPEPQFRAKPLPEFYYRTSKDIEHMEEKSLYRSIKKQIRSKELLRQSRLPFSMEQRQARLKQHARSMSATDLSRVGREEYTFKPKTNGYYVPNYDKLHEKFVRETEQVRKTRPPTKCQPFLLYTNLIPSRKDKVLDDIRSEEEMKHLQTFQIKGKQLPTKSTSGMNLSASLQQNEAIPTKTTESQRLREAIGKKKRRDDELRNRFEEKFQRSRSTREKRLREKIRDRAVLKDQSAVYKAKREENMRNIRRSMQQTEDEYAQTLDDIQTRVDKRPLLLEQEQRNREIEELERKIQHAMNVAKISEKDLMRQKYNPPNVKVKTLRSTHSSSSP